MVFKLFSKAKKDKEKAQPPQVQLSAEDLKQLEAEASQLEASLASPNRSEAELAQDQEKLGLVYAQLDKDQEAIQHLEESLALKPSIGDAYKTLLSLYNKKRAEAAKAGDDAGIDYYMGKMDDLRQMAKIRTIKGQ